LLFVPSRVCDPSYPPTFPSIVRTARRFAAYTVSCQLPTFLITFTVGEHCLMLMYRAPIFAPVPPIPFYLFERLIFFVVGSLGLFINFPAFSSPTRNGLLDASLWLCVGVFGSLCLFSFSPSLGSDLSFFPLDTIY